MNSTLDWEIIAKYISGECSREEYDKVQKWVNEDPENAQYLKELQNTWDISGKLDLKQNKDKAWQELNSRLFQGIRSTSIHRLSRNTPSIENSPLDSKRSVSVWIYRVAAVILLVSSVSYFIYSYKSNQFFADQKASTQRVMREVTAERGQRVRVKFSDGTNVILNASSSIRFPGKFDEGVREVELTGEAYFSVAHKDNIPFIVHTDKADVQVLGTKFNVSAYPQDPKMEVVVAKGKVAVRSDRKESEYKDQGEDSHPHSQNDEVILTRGQYTEVGKGERPEVPRIVRLENYFGWVRGRLVFDETPLKDVVNRLEHYYDRQFIISDTALYDRRLTAVFERESFSKVLDVMALAMDMKYKREPGQNEIKLEPCDSNCSKIHDQ